MTSPRQQLANDLAAGLSGWLQLHTVQNLGGLSGEDAARFVCAQIVNAQARYLPETSQLPQNWGSTKKRIDVALKPRSTGGSGWYGAIEIKWPGNTFDAHQVRLHMVQDSLRMTFVATSSLNAKFVVLGGSDDAITKLFDTPHPQAADREARREAFGSLYSRDPSNPDGEATFSTWSTHFPEAGDRVPSTIFGTFKGKLKTKLLARSDALVGSDTAGTVLVWQCNRARGSSS